MMSGQLQSPYYTILGMTLTSPIIVGSGLLTDQAKNIRQLLAHDIGAVVTKTIYPQCERKYPERIYAIETGLLNNTTYSKRSVTEWLTWLAEFRQEELPVIASVHAPNPAELGKLAAQIARIGETPLELGISCLHADDFTGDTPERVYSYAAAVRQNSDASFAVKLSLGKYLYERVQAAVEGGAKAVTLSDTVSGIAFDRNTGEAVLGGICGYSGPGIKPLVLAAIYNLRKEGLSIPIMGSGGIQNGIDIHEYIWAGAQIVQIYSALHRDMFPTLIRISEEYQQKCQLMCREVIV